MKVLTAKEIRTLIARIIHTLHYAYTSKRATASQIAVHYPDNVSEADIEFICNQLANKYILLKYTNHRGIKYPKPKYQLNFTYLMSNIDVLLQWADEYYPFN